MSLIVTSPSPDEVVDRVQTVSRCEPYSEQTMGFMGSLSNRLLRDASLVRQFPDAAAFGDWIRPRRIREAASRLSAIESLEGGMRVGRGLSLHIAPENVEALFAYSWAAATLAGCSSVVRVSSHRSGMTEALVSANHKVSDDLGMSRNWEFVHWENEDDLRLGQFTSAADILVFWGSDKTVTRLSSAPSRPHTHTHLSR